MSQFTFERYTVAVEQAERRRRQGGRPPKIPRVPMLELPVGLEKSQTERPGPDTAAVMFEAGVVAGALLHKGVAFDRVLAPNHPNADTEVGAWSLSPQQDHSQYNLRAGGRPADHFNRVHLEPAILGENGRIYFSFRELHHDIGPDLPPEPVVGLRAPGEGSIENEQIRHGLARLSFTHELDLRIPSAELE